MPQLQQADLRNRLLRALAPEDFAALQPALRPDDMAIRQILIAPRTPIETVHFLEAGIVSVTNDGARGRVEIGLIGREGLVGAAPILLGDDRTPYTHFVQAPGLMLSIEARVLLGVMEERPAVRLPLLRYIHTYFAQTAHTAFANARGNTAMRLARWLLMYQDRSDGDTVMVTHEFMSLMLGVERPGVTAALRMLERDGFVRKHRGLVEIVDREGLLDLAGDSYGMAEAEYDRLIDGLGDDGGIPVAPS
ncbi:Crp/Fnr family transcriptional regulator [Methylobacterium pseudosasicola]|uniref:cAMP-binding domain of CRP or a regulatory subunit of cAMP-dependent protein kinases n=1 Tax=Methylobacterium pseudosasicola TaxID=582667 RepID=A0A1I4GQZ0_9HYPH|nr:Crp/Fnr family transcriptional regulator [Methylobacterium pseudosasicola]SFL32319.1 cAMP-binding domain of CRP or a regulatory subunit of cAMP-dependent protein kinases [Methylobacterium pseudosasicola]